MKQFNLILLFHLIARLAYAQPPKEISNPEIAKLKQEVQKESLILMQDLQKKEYLNDFNKQVTIAFQMDTFLIERFLSKRIAIDYSTAGMTKATYDAEIEYDKLLNKYYQWLLKKLSDSDKELLKQSQRNWIQYRDSERKLNSTIARDEYSSGGSIQSMIVASVYAEITKRRVAELINYLSRFNE